MATKSPYLLSKFSNSSQLHLEELLVSSDRDLAIITIEMDTREDEAAVTHVTTNVDQVTAEEVEDMAMVVDTTIIETTTREERMTTVRIMMMTMKTKDQEVVDIEVEGVAFDQEVDLRARGETVIIEEVDLMATGEMVITEEVDIMVQSREMAETIKDQEMVETIKDLEMVETIKDREKTLARDQEMARISKNSQEMSRDITKVDIREREDTTMNHREKDHAMMTGIETEIKEAITIEDQEELEVTIEEEEEEDNPDTTNDLIIVIN